MIELQRHSSIFGDTAVQFLKDDLNLIDAIFDKAAFVRVTSFSRGTKNISRVLTKF